MTIPHFPWMRACQACRVPTPRGDTIPMPVTTTRRRHARGDKLLLPVVVVTFELELLKELPYFSELKKLRFDISHFWPNVRVTASTFVHCSAFEIGVMRSLSSLALLSLITLIRFFSYILLANGMESAVGWHGTHAARSAEKCAWRGLYFCRLRLY